MFVSGRPVRRDVEKKVRAMPRYDYRCPACETTFEVEHGMREHPEVTCPKCGAPMARVLNTSGIVLKGSGFYNTDMRGKKGGTEATGAGKSEGEGSTALAKKEGSSETAIAKSEPKEKSLAKTEGTGGTSTKSASE